MRDAARVEKDKCEMYRFVERNRLPVSPPARRPADHLFPADACGDCHRPTTWMASTFDHARDTGWGLKGAHAALAAPGNCDRCHASQGAPVSASCDQCHAEGARHFWTNDACGDCHQPTHWSHVSKIGGFLASAHTGFGADTSGLRGAHAVADCSSCHLSEGTTLGGAGQACADCHSMPAAPAHGPAWTECHDCHDPFPGWPAKRGWRQNMPASLP